MKYLFLSIGDFKHLAVAKRFLGTGEELAKLGEEVWIAVMKCEENDRRIQLEAPHCKVIYYEKGNIVKEIWSKLRAIWKIRPDIVYAASYTPRTLAFFRFLFPRKTRSIVEFCELYSAYSGHGKPWRLFEYIACRENDGILCASRVLESHFKAVCLRHRLHRNVCYSPYAFPKHLEVRVAEPTCPPVVLFMASLWKEYGVYEVLGAFERVLNEGVDAVLEILGGGPEKEAVMNMVAKKGLGEKIHVRGYVDEEELNGYFSSASVFVAPLKDTFQDRARCPSKVFFYIPFNKPIVTCQFGNPYDVLQEYAFYYRPDDVADLARAVEQALDASRTFSYPVGFVESHSWKARARQMQEWVKTFDAPVPA